VAYTAAFIVCSFPRIANDMRHCFGFLDVRFKLGPTNGCVGSAEAGLRMLTGGVR